MEKHSTADTRPASPMMGVTHLGPYEFFALFPCLISFVDSSHRYDISRYWFIHSFVAVSSLPGLFRQIALWPFQYAADSSELMNWTHNDEDFFSSSPPFLLRSALLMRRFLLWSGF